MSAFYLDDLPTDSNGKLSRQRLLDTIGFSKWYQEDRAFVSVYCGSSPGNHPAYIETARALGRMIDEEGWVLVNGGGTSGLMLASNQECKRTLSFTTRPFSVPTDDPEKKEGLNPNALNVVLPDFFERKACMDLLSDVCFVLPGGFGTLDEAFEAIIFAQKMGRKVIFINTLGIWDPLRKQLEKWAKKGLMPPHYSKQCCFVPTQKEAIEIAREHIRALSPGNILYSSTPKPTESLRCFLEENGHLLQERVLEILCDLGAFAQEAPRIGLIASGNIGAEKSGFNFNTARQRDEICRNTSLLGRDIACSGTLAVIPGDRSGLRRIAADAILENVGKILWVRKGAVNAPLQISSKNDREICLTVPRHYEIDRLTTLLSTSIVTICGGLHTADRTFGFLTRNQTGHGCYSDLLPNYDRNAQRPVIHCYNPPLGNGEGFWTPLQKQIQLCVESGFAKKENLDLIVFAETTKGLVHEAIEKGWGAPTNVLFEIPRKNPGALTL